MLKNLVHVVNFSQSVKRFISNFKVIMQSGETMSYEQAIIALNNLESNESYLKTVKNNNLTPEYKLLENEKFFNRSGIRVCDLDKLSVIHVSGTKGKGTTCAICENILLQHGYKTGFFSSPHLIEVCERIRINGVPIEKEKFAHYFWNVYNSLLAQKDHPDDMPKYFAFLTILAYNVFLKENVDVAIIEVGIGGELDNTNIVRKTDIVGITSLGLDHTSILGNTLEEIAWQKGGIMKENCKAFTTPQSPEALNILKQRSIERKCSLEVVEPSNINYNLNIVHMLPEVFNVNASLAIAMAKAWVLKKGFNPLQKNIVKYAVENISWPGRFQIVSSNNLRCFLDGAHTYESLEICVKWFINYSDQKNKKALLFNTTGDRDSERFLKILSKCGFNYIYFVPNKAFDEENVDQTCRTSVNQQLIRCEKHLKVWQEIGLRNDHVQIFRTVNEAFLDLYNKENENFDVLITGSLHLVGAALSVFKFMNNKI